MMITLWTYKCVMRVCVCVCVCCVCVCVLVCVILISCNSNNRPILAISPPIGKNPGCSNLVTMILQPDKVVERL